MNNEIGYLIEEIAKKNAEGTAWLPTAYSKM